MTTRKKVAESKETQEVSELPVIKSVTIYNTGKGYTVLTIYTQGDKVINVESTEPNLYPIAVMNAKVAFESIL